jgi:hypothetical protein
LEGLGIAEESSQGNQDAKQVRSPHSREYVDEQ